MKAFLKRSALFAFLLLGLHAKAALYIITNTNDSTAVTSLRGAIIAANNSTARENVIILGVPPQRHHVYRLTLPGVDEYGGFTGDLNVSRGNLIIEGYSTNVTIDATGLGDRVFLVLPGARLTLENLTITGGSAPTGNTNFLDGELGGAIENFGTLFLDRCIITNNMGGSGQYIADAGGTGIGIPTKGGDGGGIYNFGIMEAKNCLIEGNFGGPSVDGGNGGNGGGIGNDGSCTFVNCTISQNEGGAGAASGNGFGSGGSGGNGGGIFNTKGMTLSHCIIGMNSSGQGADGNDGLLPLPAASGGNGGGIYNMGQMKISFSTICWNDTGDGGNDSPGQGGDGGGIFNDGNLNLDTCTISGNSCGKGGDEEAVAWGNPAGGTGGSGSGVYNSNSNELLGLKPGLLKITSSTVTLNMCGTGGSGYNFSDSYAIGSPAGTGGAGGSGGGVLNSAEAKCVVIGNSLIVQNLANSGGPGGTNTFWYFTYSNGQPSMVTVTNIGNLGTNGVGFDVCGGFTSKGFNLIGTGDGSTGFGVKADQVGTDDNMINPLLGPLQMNGGFTPTHALLWGSPAIDQGKSFGVGQDQRGEHRPCNYSSIPKPSGGDNNDIGAFELNDKDDQ